MRLLFALCFAMSISAAVGCGGGTMEPGPPPEGTVSEEPEELSEDELAQEEAANPDAAVE